MSDSPEDDVSPEEMAQAAALAEQVDGLVAGKGAAVALSEDERERLQSAAMIYAAHHEVMLPEERQAALIEEALAGATGASRASFDESVPSDLDRARAKRRIGLGVTVLGVVAAAVVVVCPPPLPKVIMSVRSDKS